MELKVQRTANGISLEGSVPHGISDAPSVEIFPLRDGAYLLAVKGFLDRASAPLQPPNAPQLTEPERALLKKLLAIRFEKRTPAEVDRTLSPKERETLSALLKKKVVTVFQSPKYKDGVYNVSDAAYGQAREIPAQSAGPAHAAPPAPNDPLFRGWLTLENEGEARYLSNSLADRIKAGEVSGLRAFDRKYYFIRKGFAEKWQPKFQAALEKGDRTAEELAREVGLDPEGCRAILLHLCEAGELLEKSRGKFALA
jgi:hypothetical protein